MKVARLARRELAGAKDAEGQHGVLHAALDDHEGEARHDRGHERGHHAARRPAHAGSLDETVDERAEGHGRQAGAGQVEAADGGGVAASPARGAARSTPRATTNGRLMRKMSRHDTAWIR